MRRTESSFEALKKEMADRGVILNLKYEDYISNEQKVSYICMLCGQERITCFRYLAKGCGCPECSKEIKRQKMRRTKEQFSADVKLLKEERNIIFNVDYENYTNGSTKESCICVECGHEWHAVLNSLKYGIGCPKCATNKNSDLYRKTEFEFMEDARSLSERNIDVLTRYNEYKNCYTKLNCKCTKCGSEWISCLNSLLSGYGCLQCSLRDSSLERDFISMLSEMGVRNIVRNDREILGGKEIDIYLPDYKIGFELHGLYWHSEKFVRKGGGLQEKFIMADNKGVRLYQFFSDELKIKSNIIKCFVSNKLSQYSDTLGARKCTVVEMTKENKGQFKEFVGANHISGWVNCKFAFGLTYKEDLVAVLTFRSPFTKKYKNTIEIARFCCEGMVSVPGAFGKLYKYFVSSQHSAGLDKVLSYADLRFGNGDIYLKNGFDFIGKTEPNYFYTDFKKRFHRFKFRAQNGKPEKQIAEEAGVVKIYDAGSYIFLKNIIK